jgi:guanine deaminase
MGRKRSGEARRRRRRAATRNLTKNEVRARRDDAMIGRRQRGAGARVKRRKREKNKKKKALRRKAEGGRFGMTEPSSLDDEDEDLRWIFRGNVVVPTGNPFSVDVQREFERRKEGAATNRHRWLGPGLRMLPDHVLAVDSATGFIRRLEPASDELLRSLSSRHSSSAEVVEMSSTREFLCPGFIDLHIHAPQYSYAGTATDRPLMGDTGWLETYTFPAERRLRDDLDHARRVYGSVVSTALRFGTTTAVYFATLDAEPCKVLVDCCLEQGQRALIGKVCMDRNSPIDCCQSLEQNLAEAEVVIQHIHDKVERRRIKEDDKSSLPLILPVVTPRFIPTCSPALLSALGDMAARHNCHVTSHISESVDEVEFSQHLDATVDGGGGGGRTDAAIFDSHRLLTDQCVMAHAVHLTDEDMDLMKERRSAVAHCPLSNFYFAGGTLPCRKLLQRGNLVGLGTDVAGGYSASMLHSQRMAVIASKAVEHRHHHQQQQQKDMAQAIDYRHAFYLATLGGAESLRLNHRIGTFAVGMEFDAILLSADVRSPVEVFDSDSLSDIFQKLCVLGDDRNVKRVFVQGRDVTRP